MTDRYDWERDRARKQDRDPRALRGSDQFGEHSEESSQWRGEHGSADNRYSSANRYSHGYDNRDDSVRWAAAGRDRGEESRGGRAARIGGGYSSGYGASHQTGDYFGPGDYGSGNHAYAANWGTGYGAYGNSADHASSRDHWRGGYGGGQFTQREGRSRQMGGGEYQRGEGYAHDDFNRGFLDRAADEVMSWWGDEEAARRREQDHREDHRGRGPANYTRSDERIREDANDSLTDDWRVDARRISVAVENGEVTLTGTVATRQDKHRAEECVERISGVRHVQNNLRVEGSGSTASVTTQTGQPGAEKPD